MNGKYGSLDKHVITEAVSDAKYTSFLTNRISLCLLSLSSSSTVESIETVGDEALVGEWCWG